MRVKIVAEDLRVSEISYRFEEVDEHFDWHWTEGNNGCDCARAEFFGFNEAPCNSGDNLIRIEVYYEKGLGWEMFGGEWNDY